MKLSIIICAHNEKETILEIVRRVRVAELPSGWSREIFIVDNLSTDGTRELLKTIERDSDINVLYQEVNYGKSHSVRKAIPFCSGDYVLPQDADLEYDPADYISLIEKVISEDLDVVIGSRSVEKGKFHAYRINQWGISRLTSITNYLFGTSYTDIATCYKLMRASKLKELNLKSNGFNLDFELCAKFSKLQWSIGEVEISYQARTFAQGRKLRPIVAGISALWTIIKEKYFRN